MRWVGVVTALSIGCAATPAPLAIAPPERCVCAAPAVDCAAGATAQSATSPARPYDYRDYAGLGPALEAAIVAADTGAAVKKDGPGACAEISDVASALLADFEPEIVSAVQAARTLRTSNIGSSSTEREFLAWQAYDAAVADARERLTLKLATPFADAVVTGPNVTKSLQVAVNEALAPVYGPKSSPAFVDIARERAPAVLRAEFVDATAACAGTVVDRARGRWVAIFNGKT